MLIPQSTVEALRKAHANGHKLFLCTGRNRRMTQPLLDYGFDGAVCSAGGYVFCGDKVLVDLPMEPQLAEGVRSAMERHGVECTLEARDATYGSLKMIERWSFTHRDAGNLNSEAARWRKAMEDGMTMSPLADYKGEPLYKIVYIAEHSEDLDEAKRLYEDRFVFCESKLDGLDGGYVNGELINRKFDKGRGIKAVCDYLGVPLQDSIGFGDSDNDLQMTDVVGISVCMANGSASLKQRCDRIAPLGVRGRHRQGVCSLGADLTYLCKNRAGERPQMFPCPKIINNSPALFCNKGAPHKELCGAPFGS